MYIKQITDIQEQQKKNRGYDTGEEGGGSRHSFAR